MQVTIFKTVSIGIVAWASVLSISGCVEETGQIECFDTFGSEIDCRRDPTAQGQDGAVRSGVAHPTNPRFIDNDDGTITDLLTGLIWLKNANCFGRQQWPEALKLASDLGSDSENNCGLLEGRFTPGLFRLPSVKELRSLINFAYFSPAIADAAGTGQCTDGDPSCAFENVGGGRFYWSSTSRIDRTNDNASASKALGVHTRDGRSIGHFKYWGNATRFFVWPVAGPDPDISTITPVVETGQTQCWSVEPPIPPLRDVPPEELDWCVDDATGSSNPLALRQDGALRAGFPYTDPRFTDFGNGTVLDNLTQLVWLQDANCFGDLAWSDALVAVNMLEDSDACPEPSSRSVLNDGSSAGQWRLPNVRELQSLLDFGAAVADNGRALPLGHPFARVRAGFYWSSTSMAGDPFCAWSVAMRSGLTHFDTGGGGSCTKQRSKLAERKVWAVRDRRSLEAP